MSLQVPLNSKTLHTSLTSLRNETITAITNLINMADEVVLTDETPITFLDKHGNEYSHVNLQSMRKSGDTILFSIENSYGDKETFQLNETTMSVDDLIYVLLNIEDVLKSVLTI